MKDKSTARQDKITGTTLGRGYFGQREAGGIGIRSEGLT